MGTWMISAARLCIAYLCVYIDKVDKYERNMAHAPMPRIAYGDAGVGVSSWDAPISQVGKPPPLICDCSKVIS